MQRIRTPSAGLTLRTKGVIVVALPVCALLAAMGVFYQFEQQTHSAQASVEHTYRVRSEMGRIFQLMSNAETGTSRYLLTGRRSLLDDYLTARRTAPERLAALGKLTSDNPVQSERLVALRGTIEKTFQAMASLQGQAMLVPGATVSLNIDASGAGMGELRGELATMRAEEDRLLKERTAAVVAAQRRLELAIFIGGALGLLGGILSALFFTTRIARRVHHIEEVAGMVALGIPLTGEVRGHDEIAQVERTLRETSRLLAEQSEELRASQAQLETRVEQRTAELTAANAELHQANEVRQAVVASSPLAIWAIDLAGKVTFWNATAERIFGWPAGEVIGRGLPIIPDDQKVDYGHWLERFRSGEQIVGAEQNRARKDGSLIAVSVYTAPLRDAAGDVCGTITIDNDITEHRRLEEQLRQSQKLEAVGRLAGGVAHDFNNLLTVITGYGEMLAEETAGDPRLIGYIREIQYAADRATALTGQLLTFSRRRVGQPKVLNLNEVVMHSLKLLGRVIGEDIKISTHMDPHLASVNADATHLDQVVMNLVVNARDAMNAGGQLTIETANVMLDEHYAGRHIGAKPGPYAVLAISDTGQGMDAETRSRLFEPFFTTKEAGKGTGLGLSIVYGIVKQAGGEITVYSEPGKGTTFRVYLPAVTMTAESATAAGQTVELRGTETVLLCEDEAGIRKLVQAMLEKHGYRVIEAETPEKALEVARRSGEKIHLLLTDIVMPQTSGFDLAKAVSELRPKTKVVYMSGYTDNRVSGTWALEPGMAFLQKPFTAASLTRKVREALDG